jgi:hypothetical protein
VYETSPQTQKQKQITSLNVGVGSKQLVASGKSRQPNHIISCGGILSTKLASATVQDSASLNSKSLLASLLEMDMNAIIKKLGAGKKPEPENLRYGQPMSFVGKKITAVAHHQVDATKRLSMNL